MSVPINLNVLDVMIALHACDVATDYAIHTGIRLGAAVIMCAPCCHKQIRPQLHSPMLSYAHYCNMVCICGQEAGNADRWTTCLTVRGVWL
jgi:hypothetical protein